MVSWLVPHTKTLRDPDTHIWQKRPVAVGRDRFRRSLELVIKPKNLGGCCAVWCIRLGLGFGLLDSILVSAAVLFHPPRIIFNGPAFWKCIMEFEKRRF